MISLAWALLVIQAVAVLHAVVVADESKTNLVLRLIGTALVTPLCLRVLGYL